MKFKEENKKLFSREMALRKQCQFKLQRKPSLMLAVPSLQEQTLVEQQAVKEKQNLMTQMLSLSIDGVLIQIVLTGLAILQNLTAYPLVHLIVMSIFGTLTAKRLGLLFLEVKSYGELTLIKDIVTTKKEKKQRRCQTPQLISTMKECS